MEGERSRVARAGRDGRLVGTIGIEALDRRLWLGLDAEIARRANPDIEAAVFRVDRQVPVLMPDRDAEDTLLRQQLRAIGGPARINCLDPQPLTRPRNGAGEHGECVGRPCDRAPNADVVGVRPASAGRSEPIFLGY
jgi:hypothetical protein